MCGIAGALSLDGSDAVALDPMLDALHHRGPEDRGEWRDGPAALGQTRLSIIDLEGGRQPIVSVDGDLVLVCNGEIYNSPALRRTYRRAGYRFRTRTDVEVILPAYLEHGPDCVHELRGMYAFAVWDRARQRLFLARDRMGIKPLFFARTAGHFLFASEVKAILATGLVERKLDRDGLWHYVSLRYLPDDYTLFEGVHKVEAAHWLRLENGALTRRRYWTLSFRPKRKAPEKELLDEVERRLLDTVDLHLLSDVPVGTFLSGGIDSSLVTAAFATRHPDIRVPTFSVGVEEADYDELGYARMVARRYDTDHHERVVAADLVNALPTMVWHLDEPSDPFAVGCWLVSREAAREVKVVLSGDGGDELFAGYDRYVGQRFAELYGMVPAPLRKAFSELVVERVPETMGYKSLAKKLRWLSDMAELSGGDRYARSLSFLRFTPEAKDRLFTTAFRSSLTDGDSLGRILEIFHDDAAEHPIDRMLHVYLVTRIPDHLLTTVDRMTMAHSVEGRPPLLDHEFVEFACSLPAPMKLKRNRLKYPLRRVAERYLDRELVRRRKQGFGFPIASWMRGPLRGLLEGFLRRDSHLVASGLLEAAEVGRLLEDHLEGREDHNFRLWILLNLEYWHRIHIEGMPLDEVRLESARTLSSG